MKKILLALSLVILTALSATGLADSAIQLHTFDPSRGDLSMNFLGQIFGTVGTVLHGNSGQMLGVVFKVLNEAFVIVAGLWLFYTVLTVVMRAATEGSFMGQGKNTLFIFVRVAFGIGLLLPMPGSGYSAMQEVVMFVVKQSVGVANLTWNKALDYIDIGGSIYTPPDSNNKISATNNLNDVNKVVAAAACMSYNAYYSQLQTNSNNLPQGDNSIFSTGEITRAPTYHIVGNQINFPETVDARPESTACGSFSWANDATGQGMVQQAAIQQVVQDIQGPTDEWGRLAAKEAVGDKVTEDEKQAADAAMVSAMTNAAIDYSNITMPLRFKAQTDMDSGRRAFIANAKSDGWMFAGRYYWDMLTAMTPLDDSAKNATGIAATNGVSPDYSKLLNHDTSAMGDLYDTIDGSVSPLDKQYTDDQGQSQSGSYKQRITNQFAEYDAGSGTGGGFYDETMSGVRDSSFTGAILSLVFGGFGGLINDMWHPSQNPIFWLHHIGVDCMEIFVQVWIGSLVSVGIISLSTGLCSAIQSTGASFQAVVGWLKPILFGLTSVLLIAGIMLGYYLPLYPYFVFMFGVVGWLITVVETMVAAPMVCLGLTHPEGHDFLGKAEQALMLLLNVFIRPVLMVIGLIVAMVMMYVTLRILNAGFVGILQDTTQSFLNSSLTGHVTSGAGSTSSASISGGGIGGAITTAAAAAGASSLGSGLIVGGLETGVLTAAIMIIVLIPILLLIYGVTLYEVVSMVFSLIHVLPDRISRWIGMQQEQSETQQRIGQAKGNLSQSAGNVLNMHQMLESGRSAKEGRAEAEAADAKAKAKSGKGGDRPPSYEEAVAGGASNKQAPPPYSPPSGGGSSNTQAPPPYTP